ncbi:hypothetical protein BG011_003954 [Mortierella polycephala]|uniref:Uncharacterized protein n=1 Tax=Mortierella polycephala TaxID=41804 RepID=A0A9P6U2A3_9FUNG|nr:hypothetical protein BG011_003954 [Mortierella polycephala]
MAIDENSMITPLFQYLDASPNLLELYIASNAGSNRVTIVSGDADDQIVDLPEPPIDPETAHFPRKPKKVISPATYPEQYRLQAFECTNVIMEPRVLGRIVAICPNLRVF